MIETIGFFTCKIFYKITVMKNSKKIDMFEFMEMSPDERSARKQFEKMIMLLS